MTRHRFVLGVGALVLASTIGARVEGQVGKGIVDFNTAAERDLASLPIMTPAIAKGLVDKRPFSSILEVNAFLLSQNLTAEQTTAIYEKAFVHLNLNTCTVEEILLIPRARRMRIEFPEYRPWKNWAQFDKEIGKYVAQTPGELDRLKQYVFIPLDLNTVSDEDLMTIPGVNPGLLKTFKDHRPWKSKEQFDQEIGKSAGAKEATRLWRYVTIQ